jgi:ADP-ribose diphosphatase
MSEPILFESRIFNVVRKIQTTADGVDHKRDIVEHPGAVVVVPVNDEGKICLIKNFRIAVGQTLLELPAGTREPDEPVIETAHRELIEETGYRAGKIEPLLSFFSSPGISTEEMHLFVATDLTPGEMALEAGEQIEPILVELEEAIGMVADGKIRDGKTVAGLLYYDRFC